MKFTLLGLLLLWTLHLPAQKTLSKWTEETVSADPEMILYLNSDTKKPLNGKFKLVPEESQQGAYIICEFQKGYLHNQYSEYKQTKLVAEINYRNGKKDGAAYLYYPDGNVKSETFYVNGEKNGKETSYYDRGKIKEEYSYRNGQKDGPFITYNSYNGDKTSEGQYVHGVLDGRYIEFVTDDVVDYKKEIEYRQGEILKYKEFTLNGTLIKETNYKFVNNENLKDGKELIYDPANGRLIRENRYKNGKEDSFQIDYDERGNRAVESYYKEGEQQYIYFNNPDGKGGRLRTENFKNGKRVSIYYHAERTGNIYEMKYYNGDKYTGRYETFYPNRVLKEKVTSREKVNYYENGKLQSRSVLRGGKWIVEEEYDEKGNKIN